MLVCCLLPTVKMMDPSFFLNAAGDGQHGFIDALALPPGRPGFNVMGAPHAAAPAPPWAPTRHHHSVSGSKQWLKLLPVGGHRPMQSKCLNIQISRNVSTVLQNSHQRAQKIGPKDTIFLHGCSGDLCVSFCEVYLPLRSDEFFRTHTERVSSQPFSCRLKAKQKSLAPEQKRFAKLKDACFPPPSLAGLNREVVVFSKSHIFIHFSESKL